MKIAKGLFPLLLVCLALLCLGGCSNIDKTDVEAVITNELDLLKNLDSDTTQKYVSYTELFPDTASGKLSKEIKEVFSLFFADFDYKIQSINVDKDNTEATAVLKLHVIDASALARDYARKQLESDIQAISETASDSEEEYSPSMTDRYLIMRELLKENSYSSVDRECTLTLNNAGSQEKPEWEISCTYTLENDLVGGLMTNLSDSNLLTPEETLSVYLSTLKSMDTEHMGNYLGIDSLLNTSDTTKNEIAAALAEKVHSCFDYSIVSSSVASYSASVDVEITTFDSDAILASYQEDLDEYLGSVDAVIDGQETRYEKSLDLLLSHIESSEETTVSTATFQLSNDGASWKLKDASSAIGEAIFGSLTSTPTSDDSADGTEDTSYDTEDTGDDSDDSDDTSYDSYDSGDDSDDSGDDSDDSAYDS